MGRSGESMLWRGSAFDCRDNDISLIHSRFESGLAVGECNNGSIKGQGIRVEGSCYTAQLNITVSSDMIGKTIECVHDNSTETIIGTLTVATVGETWLIIVY